MNRLGRVGHSTQWTFFPFKPGTYSWGVQTIDAAYNGSVFTEGPQFTVTEEDIASSLNSVSRQDKGMARWYNLAGQQLPKPQRGINIISNRKVMQGK